ncbi:hypothetical protein CYY_001249 [Polysphondylium violaceum]|uniref:Adenylyl cyclase n=1 Tax=Polysphondylium violaceum TaxID=133409 RepID=A0A8J4UWE7_9MYCE|nr:hypothetical protein CYY_001249 [Polysphondylium violaceum]
MKVRKKTEKRNNSSNSNSSNNSNNSNNDHGDIDYHSRQTSSGDMTTITEIDYIEEEYSSTSSSSNSIIESEDTQPIPFYQFHNNQQNYGTIEEEDEEIDDNSSFSSAQSDDEMKSIKNNNNNNLQHQQYSFKYNDDEHYRNKNNDDNGDINDDNNQHHNFLYGSENNNIRFRRRRQNSSEEQNIHSPRTQYNHQQQHHHDIGNNHYPPNDTNNDPLFFSNDSESIPMTDDIILNSKFPRLFFTNHLHIWLSYLLFAFVVIFCCLSVGPLLWLPISSHKGCAWCKVFKLEWIISFMSVVSSFFHFTIRKDMFPLYMALVGFYHVISHSEPFLEPYRINNYFSIVITLVCSFVAFYPKYSQQQKKLKYDENNNNNNNSSVSKWVLSKVFQKKYLKTVGQIILVLVTVILLFFSILLMALVMRDEKPSESVFDMVHDILSEFFIERFFNSSLVYLFVISFLFCITLVYHWEVKKPYTLMALASMVPQLTQALYMVELAVAEVPSERVGPLGGGIFYILNVVSYTSFFCGLAIDVVLASGERYNKLKREGERYHRRLSTQINEQNEFVQKVYDTGNAQILEKVDFMQKFVEQIIISNLDTAKKISEIQTSDLNSRQSQTVNSIQQDSNHTLLLLNDVKLVLAIESGLISREDMPMNLFDFLEELIEKTSKDIKTNEIELVYRIDKNVPLNLIFDPTALLQICFQLLSNSIKFTEKGEIGILIKQLDKKLMLGFNAPQPKDNGGEVFSTTMPIFDNETILLEISIFDTGIGMTDEELELCNRFQPFPVFKSKSKSIQQHNKKQGSGLGLLISYKICKSIGGEIKVERNESGGLIFRVRFPVNINTIAKSSLPLTISPQYQEVLNSLSALVIDDNMHSRYTCDYILKGLLQCKSVRLAGSSVEGIRELKLATLKTDINLLLVDYHMPGCDGLETIQMVKDNPNFKDIKIILMVLPYDVILKNENLNDIILLTKPATPVSLLNAISKCFEMCDINNSDNQVSTYTFTNNNLHPFDQQDPNLGNTGMENRGFGIIDQFQQQAHQSSPSQATTTKLKFNMEFPLKIPESGKPIMRVLVGENDPHIQNEIQMNLEFFGYFSTLVSDGSSLVSLAKKNYYDLIIIDLNLPVINGIDAVQMIRSHQDQIYTNTIMVPFPIGISSVSPTSSKIKSISAKRRSSLGTYTEISHKRKLKLPIIGVYNSKEFISKDMFDQAKNLSMDCFSSDILTSSLRKYLFEFEKKRKSNELSPIRLLSGGGSVGGGGSSGSPSHTPTLTDTSTGSMSPGPLLDPSSPISTNSAPSILPLASITSTTTSTTSTASTTSSITNINPNVGSIHNMNNSNNSISIPVMIPNKGSSLLKPQRRVQDLEEVISKFVPIEFQQLIAPSGMENVYLGDAISKTITIFFSDIRDFTSTTEKMLVDDVIDFLNTYLAFAIPAITERGGFIDKFIGDAIMAIFPNNDMKEQAISAVKAAVGMMKSLDFMSVSGFRFSTVETGIGINTGKTIIGIVGTETRMEPTALGDAVNLASRTEQLCKEYQSRILITQFTVEAIGASIDEFTIRLVDSVAVKGKSEVVDIYEVIDGEREEKRILKMKMLPSYQTGIENFKRRNYEDALSHFQNCNEILPNDKPTIIHIEKCLNGIREMMIEQQLQQHDEIQQVQQ